MLVLFCLAAVVTIFICMYGFCYCIPPPFTVLLLLCVIFGGHANLILHTHGSIIYLKQIINGAVQGN